MEKRYDFKKIEKQIQELWEMNKTFSFQDDGREVFSIDTPPPTVSGSLHIGHVFSYTQAEMIARFKRMTGYDVFYPFGFDDNGLPTERLVERDEGILAREISRNRFVEKCIETTEKYEEEFITLWKSLGFSVDWSLQYRTIRPEVQRISQRCFIELARRGKAYIKESPVLWCAECQTSIAQAELDIKENSTVFSYIPFRIGNETVPVATTRPELLYGCVCLFVNPDDERYVQYAGKTAVVPLYDYEIPVLTDGKVGIDKGTGVVMCATFGDSTDAQWFTEYNLPYRKVILPNGTIDASVPVVGGMEVIAARGEILSELHRRGLLIKTEEMTHTVAVHERCGAEVEILPSKQWYIDILTDVEQYRKAADKINWYPPYMKNRYISWVDNLKWDWCISRQRYFGVPFPVWYCKSCGKPTYASDEDLPINPAETNPHSACSCGCDEFIPETAVLDTWATSSVTPLINAGFGESRDISSKLLPMSMRTQAHEIIRTWAFYTIVRSLYHTGNIPWRDIMICGFVLARKGEKISKSKNNSELSPKALVETYSADVIRYWAANAKLGTDTFFDSGELAVSGRFITKLWNAARFAVPMLEDMDLNDIPELLPVDRWIIERTRRTIARVATSLNEYEIGSARHWVDELFWKDLCDYYLEIAKERLYRPDIHGYAERRSGQYALYHSFLDILKMYAVYVPHITEHIYQLFFQQYEKIVSIHNTQWDTDGCGDEKILEFGEHLKGHIADMRRYKSENNLSMKAEMPAITIKTQDEYKEWFEQTRGDIKACSNACEIIII